MEMIRPGVGAEVETEKPLSRREMHHFRIEDLELGRHALTCVSIESKYIRRTNPDIMPPDWEEQVINQMHDADILYVPYFPPELEDEVMQVPVLGRVARGYSDWRQVVYQKVAAMAAEEKLPVAVADIANKMVHAAYEFLPVSAFCILAYVGIGGVKISKSERYIPAPTDARRMLTAVSMSQYLEASTEPQRILYIAAPAHVNRVKRYLTTDWDANDWRRYRHYKKSYPGLDQETRFYEYQEEGWRKMGARAIRASSMADFPRFEDVGMGENLDANAVLDEIRSLVDVAEGDALAQTLLLEDE